MGCCCSSLQQGSLFSSCGILSAEKLLLDICEREDGIDDIPNDTLEVMIEGHKAVFLTYQIKKTRIVLHLCLQMWWLQNVVMCGVDIPLLAVECLVVADERILQAWQRKVWIRLSWFGRL